MLTLPDISNFRCMLLLLYAIVIYESTAPDILSVLDAPDQQELLQAFDLLGSALHRMRQECETP